MKKMCKFIIVATIIALCYFMSGCNNLDDKKLSAQGASGATLAPVDTKSPHIIFPDYKSNTDKHEWELDKKYRDNNRCGWDGM